MQDSYNYKGIFYHNNNKAFKNNLAQQIFFKEFTEVYCVQNLHTIYGDVLNLGENNGEKY